MREGNISTEDGLAQIRSRPAFAWVTATPHGNEPAAGEASMRLLYEMAARTGLLQRAPAAEPDDVPRPGHQPGRPRPQHAHDGVGLRPQPRPRHAREHARTTASAEAIVKYPGVFVIDAHQQGNGYFFPPNEDAVHHEVSQFAIDFIQNDIGPMLQRMFNDQSVAYQNYNVYDLFAPDLRRHASRRCWTAPRA